MSTHENTAAKLDGNCSEAITRIYGIPRQWVMLSWVAFSVIQARFVWQRFACLSLEANIPLAMVLAIPLSGIVAFSGALIYLFFLFDLFMNRPTDTRNVIFLDTSWKKYRYNNIAVVVCLVVIPIDVYATYWLSENSSRALEKQFLSPLHSRSQHIVSSVPENWEAYRELGDREVTESFNQLAQNSSLKVLLLVNAHTISKDYWSLPRNRTVNEFSEADMVIMVPDRDRESYKSEGKIKLPVLVKRNGAYLRGTLTYEGTPTRFEGGHPVQVTRVTRLGASRMESSHMELRGVREIKGKTAISLLLRDLNATLSPFDLRWEPTGITPEVYLVHKLLLRSSDDEWWEYVLKERLGSWARL